MSTGYVYGHRKIAVYPVTGEELVLLRHLPWWSRRELIDHIIEATELQIASVQRVSEPTDVDAEGGITSAQEDGHE